jgi:gas vesicle protein
MNEYQRYGDYSQQGFETSGAGTGSIITSALVGAGIGAALACLFTPKSGSELRGVIGRRYRRTVEGVSDKTRQLRDRGSNLLGFDRTSESEVQKHFRQG